MAQVSFTAAPSGTGKTFRRGPHFLVNEWLPDTSKGVHFSNLPLYVDKIVACVREKHPDMDEYDLTQRIHLIPEDVIRKWKDGLSGPWEYFADKDLDRAHIAIDEIHNFVSTDATKTKPEVRAHWAKWIGELRHRGVVECEFISQYETKVATVIRHEAALERSLMNLKDIYHPWTGCPMDDLWQLEASFTGAYEPLVVEEERQKVHGKWKVFRTVKFRLGEPYFSLYDSYSTPHAGGTKAKAPPLTYQAYTRREMLAWFWRRNWASLSIRLMGIFVFIWLMFFGGIQKLTVGAGSLFTGLLPGGVRASADEKEKAPSSQADSPSGNTPPSDELTKVKTELEALKLQIKERDERESASGQIGLIIGREVTFRNGSNYTLGQEIEEGPYKGCRIVGVDPYRRCVVLRTREKKEVKLWLGR